MHGNRLTREGKLLSVTFLHFFVLVDFKGLIVEGPSKTSLHLLVIVDRGGQARQLLTGNH
jgi:hypothetical protein